MRGGNGKAFCGGDVGVEIGFRAIKPDVARIIGVAGEKQSVDPIENRHRAGGVTRRGENFELAAEFLSWQIQAFPMV